MRSDIGHDPTEGTNPEDAIAWDGDAVRYAANDCGQRHVATPLPYEAIAVTTPAQSCQVFA